MTHQDAISATDQSPKNLSGDERLIWLLGDLMNAAENYFGAENSKRLGHINCAAMRIIDEVITPIRAFAEDEQRRRHQAEEQRTEARSEAKQLRALLGRTLQALERNWLMTSWPATEPHTTRNHQFAPGDRP